MNTETQPRILRQYYFDNHRFRVVKFLGRFGDIEYFVYDAADLSDNDVRAGKELLPFFQGKWKDAHIAIKKRQGRNHGYEHEAAR